MYSRYRKRRCSRRKKGGTTKLGLVSNLTKIKFRNPNITNKKFTQKYGNHDYNIFKNDDIDEKINRVINKKKDIMVLDEKMSELKYNHLSNEKYGKGVLNIIYYASPVINKVIFHPLKLFETLNGGLQIYYNTFSFGKSDDLIAGIISVCSPIIVAIFDDLLIDDNDINNINNIKKIIQSLIPGIDKFTFLHEHISIFLLKEGKQIALDYKKQRKSLFNITKFDSTIIMQSVIKHFNDKNIIHSFFKEYLNSIGKKISDIDIAQEIFSTSVESAKFVIRNSFEKYRILVNCYKNNDISSDIFQDYHDSSANIKHSQKIQIKKISTNWDSIVPKLLGLYNDSVKLEKNNIENDSNLNRKSKDERISKLNILPDLKHFAKTLNFNLMDLMSHLYCQGETKYLCKQKDDEYVLDITTAIVNYTFKKTNDNIDNIIEPILSSYGNKTVLVKSFFNVITLDNNQIFSNFITKFK